MKGKTKMKKYIPYVFSNGRVVPVEYADIEAAAKQNKEILVFCGAWSGGCTKAIGGEVIVEGGREHIHLYSRHISDTTFDAEQMQKFYKVIVTSGVRVYMQTGEPASTYTDRFIDQETTYEDFVKKHNYNGQTREEFLMMRASIDPKLTLHMMSMKDRPDIYAALESMASFHRV